MPGSLPHVVFRQVQRNDVARACVNLKSANTEQRKAYIDYREKVGQDHTMLEAAAANASPKLVRAVLSLGPGVVAASDHRRVWNAWANRVRMYGPHAVPSPRQLDEIEQVFNMLVESEVGRRSLVGQCWGPAHIVISTFHADPDRTIGMLEKLHLAGYGLSDVDEIGETPMAIACWEMSAPIIDWLGAQKVNLAARTSGGRTLVDFVFRDLANQPAKPTRMPEVLDSLAALHRAGYDFAPDLENQEGLSRSFGDATAFAQAIEFVRAIVEQDRLEQHTAPVIPISRKPTSRL